MKAICRVMAVFSSSVGAWLSPFARSCGQGNVFVGSTYIIIIIVVLVYTYHL